MEFEHPTWLDTEFLASILRAEDDSSPVTVKKLSVTMAVAAGDNYMSRMYRVKVEYVVEEKESCTSLIVKAPLKKGVVNDLVGECDLYDKEPMVYKEFLPLVKTLIKHQIGPKAFTNPLNNKAVILADLKELGFEMCDRVKQLDFPHCEHALKALAKLHAASVSCKRDRPDIIDLVGKEICYTQNEWYEAVTKYWIEESFKTAAGVVKEMELNKNSEELISSRVDTISDNCLKLFKTKTNGLNVLNHGDLWCNNILFKHSDSGEVVDVRLVDFQLVRYATPVLDLIYFIWSSANEDVRECHILELFEIYRSTLNSTLEELECEERLAEEELFEDLKNALDWVLITICNFLPVILSGTDVVVNAEEVNHKDIKAGRDKRFLKLYSGKQFRAALPKVMDNLQSWVSYYK